MPTKVRSKTFGNIQQLMTMLSTFPMTRLKTNRNYFYVKIKPVFDVFLCLLVKNTNFILDYLAAQRRPGLKDQQVTVGRNVSSIFRR